MKTKIQKVLVGAVLTLFAGSAFAIPVNLSLTTDDFPEETGFGLWDTATAPTPQAYFDSFGALATTGFASDQGFVEPGFFGFFDNNQTFNFNWDLGVGSHVFIIMDSFSDGICCSFGNGSYSLSVDGNQVGGGGMFASFEVTDFDIDDDPVDVPEPGDSCVVCIGFDWFRLTPKNQHLKNMT